MSVFEDHFLHAIKQPQREAKLLKYFTPKKGFSHITKKIPLFGGKTNELVAILLTF